MKVERVMWVIKRGKQFVRDDNGLGGLAKACLFPTRKGARDEMFKDKGEIAKQVRVTIEEI
jgi:hypothetical protein